MAVSFETLALAKKFAGGGGGGTSDYADLTNKPQINGETLSGNKSASAFGLSETPFTIHVTQNTIGAGNISASVSETNGEILAAINASKEIHVEFSGVWYDPLNPGPTQDQVITMSASVRAHSEDGDLIKYVVSANGLEPNKESGTPYEDTVDYYDYEAELLASTEPGYDYEIALTEQQQTALENALENENNCKFTFGFDTAFDGLKDDDINLAWFVTTSEAGYDYEVEYTEYDMSIAEITDATEIAFEFYSESGEADAVFTVEKTSTGHWSGDGWSVYYDDNTGANGMFYFTKPSGDSTDYATDTGSGNARVTYTEEQYELVLTLSNPYEGSSGMVFDLSYEAVHFGMTGLYTNGTLYLQKFVSDPVDYLLYDCNMSTVSVGEYIYLEAISGLIDWAVCVEVPVDGDEVTAYATRQKIPKADESGGGGSELPEVTSDDDGKVLAVVDGVWTAVNLPSANGVSF